jgi:hypothetical protein
VKRPDLRTDGREAVEEKAPEPPPPAVVPGSLEWASAVGNQAVARLARQADPAAEEAPAPEEEAPEEEQQEMSPEDAEAAAAVADVDEEQLPAA